MDDHNTSDVSAPFYDEAETAPSLLPPKNTRGGKKTGGRGGGRGRSRGRGRGGGGGNSGDREIHDHSDAVVAEVSKSVHSSNGNLGRVGKKRNRNAMDAPEVPQGVVEEEGLPAFSAEEAGRPKRLKRK